MEIIGRNAVQLALPTNSKIYPVVNFSLTSCFFQLPDIESHYQAPLPPINNENPDELEVHEIIAHQKLKNRYQFLVHWKGYASHVVSWKPTQLLFMTRGLSMGPFSSIFKSGNFMILSQVDRPAKMQDPSLPNHLIRTLYKFHI